MAAFETIFNHVTASQELEMAQRLQEEEDVACGSSDVSVEESVGAAAEKSASGDVYVEEELVAEGYLANRIQMLEMVIETLEQQQRRYNLAFRKRMETAMRNIMALQQQLDRFTVSIKVGSTASTSGGISVEEILDAVVEESAFGDVCVEENVGAATEESASVEGSLKILLSKL
ncbi:hypothetical protein L6164_012861 [Bauhinia variegata]|uniref:Uncharacterized protein n=1 Tax=Bauhinia variegata TaxID=167791 RepID=A0ACB9PBB3_BAUVA|nr:hypothetical protein L6164_012861 [Bauhinia variegata]